MTTYYLSLQLFYTFEACIYATLTATRTCNVHDSALHLSEPVFITMAETKTKLNALQVERVFSCPKLDWEIPFAGISSTLTCNVPLTRKQAVKLARLMLANNQ